MFRYMFIICKATGHSNYSCGLLETIAQSMLLPNHLRDALVHHRFANRRGQADSNIPLDLLMEQQNRSLKEDLHTYRGEYSQSHLDNISLGSNLSNETVLNIDKQHSYFISKGKGTPDLSLDDIKLLVSRYKDAELFTDIPLRTHCSELAFICNNPTKTMTKKELRKWIAERIGILQTKNVYKQFDRQQEAQSYDFAALFD